MREQHIEESEVALLEEVTTGVKLILYNDDVNTFDHVIECLVRICNHDALQAEQSAMLVHYKGKCVVKTGDRGELAAMCQALCDEDLSAALGE
jgi:ATP-dependent Clp protease adaptor protein ClpS